MVLGPRPVRWVLPLMSLHPTMLHMETLMTTFPLLIILPTMPQLLTTWQLMLHLIMQYTTLLTLLLMLLFLMQLHLFQ